MMYNGAINLALFLVWAFSRCFSSARSQMLTIYNLSRTVFIKEEKINLLSDLEYYCFGDHFYYYYPKSKCSKTEFRLKVLNGNLSVCRHFFSFILKNTLVHKSRPYHIQLLYFYEDQEEGDKR